MNHQIEVDEFQNSSSRRVDVLLKIVLLPELTAIVRSYSQTYPERSDTSYGYINDEGLKDGLWISWYNNKNARVEEYYVDGKLHGKRTERYLDGGMYSQIYYNMGLIDMIGIIINRNPNKQKTLDYELEDPDY